MDRIDTGILRAAVYPRVSSKAQEEEGASLETQEAAIRRYCAEKGFVVTEEHVYREVHTAAVYRDRPKLTLLREAVKRGEIDVVVAYALDRLTRDVNHLGYLVSEFDAHGTRLELVTESFENSATGKFIRGAKAFAAEIELEKIRERSNRGKRNRAESGKPIHGPRPLYGYQWAGNKKARYVEDPITAPVVRRIYRMVLDDIPTRRIARTLTEEGVPTPTGLTVWPATTVAKILRTPAYAGRAQAFRLRPDLGVINLSQEVVPPLVDSNEWERVQSILERGKRAARRRPNPESDVLLRGGAIVCGYCGRHMVLGSSRGKRLYRCSGYDSRPGSCAMPSVNCDRLDDEVWRTVDAIRSRPQLIAKRLEEVLGDDPTTANLQPIVRELEDIERRRANVSREIEITDDADDLQLLRDRLHALTARKRELAARRDEMLSRRKTWDAVARTIESLRAYFESDRTTLPLIQVDNPDDPEYLAEMDDIFFQVFPDLRGNDGVGVTDATAMLHGRRAILNRLDVVVRVFRADNVEHGRWAMDTTIRNNEHNHVSWCVVGVHMGQEHETVYDLAGGGDDPHLVIREYTTNQAGSVATLIPPGDIHHVANAGDAPAVSLHIYGADIGVLGSSIRRCYDLDVRPA